VQVSGLCPVLAVDEITEQLSVSVFPNPGNGHFTLAISEKKGTVDIYNVVGKKVYHYEIKNQKSEIDISNQPEGVYFVKICTGQKMRTEKIVIQ
jgi:hypothetical protein